jgi:hypothetical protein
MTRSMMAAIAAGVVLIVAGIVLLAATDATVPSAIGFASLGAGCILLTALGFYAIGRGEDRAREAERRDRR